MREKVPTPRYDSGAMVKRAAIIASDERAKRERRMLNWLVGIRLAILLAFSVCNTLYLAFGVPPLHGPHYIQVPELNVAWICYYVITRYLSGCSIRATRAWMYADFFVYLASSIAIPNY